MTLRVRLLFGFIALIALPFALQVTVRAQTNNLDINSLIVKEVSTMPMGGDYSTKTHQAFASSIQLSPSEGLSIRPAKPSFCSGATYTIFLKTLVDLQKNSLIDLPPYVWQSLLVGMQPDGTGIWGRWNANGPGTACLFHELSLGKNFTKFSEARPGDFAKFFWTPEVGKLEHGHSVIYLGSQMQNGQEMVRFWSSNTGAGYGEKLVPRTRIQGAIFSRLTTPQNLINPLSEKNPYLASLLKKQSTFSEAQQQCGASN